MSTLTLTVVLPPSATGGHWQLTPGAPYLASGVQVTTSTSGLIDSTGALKAQDGVTSASVPLPAYPATTGLRGTLEITFTGGLPVRGRPIRVELRETSAGVMDVPTLINAARRTTRSP